MNTNILKDIISFLRVNPNSNIYQIDRSLPQTYSTIHRYVKRMEKNKLIKSIKHEKRDIHYYSVTSDAIALYLQLIKLK